MINPGEPTHERVIFETSDQPPAMLTLTRQAYPEGSIGHQLFPEALEGRIRPVTFADAPLNLARVQTATLMAAGIETIGDLMQMNADQAVALLPEKSQAGFQEKVQGRLDVLAEKFILTPHARLIQAALREEQGPVGPEEEPQIVRYVEMALSQLRPRDRHILSLRFGLDGSPAKSLGDTGDYYALSRERIRQIESKALSMIRHSSRRDTLDEVSVFPTSSIARSAGYTYRRALPLETRKKFDIELSPEANAVIADLAVRTSNTTEAYRARQYRFARDAGSVSELIIPEGNEEVTVEIIQKFQRFVRVNKHFHIFGRLLIDIAALSALGLNDPERLRVETQVIINSLDESITELAYTITDEDGNERPYTSPYYGKKSPQALAGLARKLGSYLDDLFPTEETATSEQ